MTDVASLARIAARAASLSERLRAAAAQEATEASDAGQPDARLELWRQLIAGKDERALEERWALSGHTPADARRALSLAEPSPAATLPAWAGTLQEILLAFLDAPAAATGTPASGTLPFGDVLARIAAVAESRLERHATREQLASWSPEARLALRQRLEEQLCAICVRTLHTELTRTPPAPRTLSELLESIRFTQHDAPGGARPEGGDRRYRHFVEGLFQGGMARLVDEYPVLGRLIALAVDQWVACSSELMRRLALDFVEIRRCFPGVGGRVCGLGEPTSDPHDGGRRVLVLVFESGARLLYKCRSLGLEMAYAELTRWCSQRTPSRLALGAPRVLGRDGHGWMEFVEAAECADEAACARYFRRMGMHACLLYVLGATDCHRENWIARGEHPMLVDAETLLDPGSPLESPEADAEASVASVLRTQILPLWHHDAASGTTWNIGALAGGARGEPPQLELRWVEINTDAMRMERQPAPKSDAHGPRLSGVTVTVLPYLADLAGGFEEMYRTLVAHADALRLQASPLGLLQGQPVRVLLRPTAIYKQLIRHGMEPSVLRSGIDRSLCFESLAARFLETRSGPEAALALAVEIEALERMDVPRFTRTAETGLTRLAARLQRLGAADLRAQLAALEGACHASEARSCGAALAGSEACPAGQGDAAASAAARELAAAEVHAVAGELRRRAQRLPDQAVGWDGFVFLPDADRFQWRTLGPDLYDGNGGIALFLAAHDAVQGGDQHRDLVLAALRPVSASSAARSSSMQALGRWIGAAKGIGSIVYALTCVARLTRDERFASDALAASAGLDSATLSAAPSCDVLCGLAGAIHALLALHAHTGEPELLARARHAGHQLELRLSGAGPRGALHVPAPLDAAAALARLFASTREERWHALARRALALSRPPDASHGDAWCQGATGAALARLGGHALTDDPAFLQGVEADLERNPLTLLESLCCGQMGRVELELAASARLGRPELRERAWLRVRRMLDRPLERRVRYFPGVPGRVFSPGFFQGASGAGYTLLRLLRPQLLPSVLLWE